MPRSTPSRPWLRRAIGAAALGTMLIGTTAPALAWGSSWWWPFRPKEHSTPEIDAGLAGSAAAILVGGLLVLRARRRRS
jgi:hypothetical protein